MVVEVVAVRALEMSSELQQMVDQSMTKGSFERIDGILYQYWGHHEPPHVMLERFGTMSMRSDDVISHGISRSGNHWAFYVLEMILRQSTTRGPRHFSYSMPDVYWTENIYDQFDKEPSPRLMGTHVNPRLYLRQVLEKTPRFVYILRNPKDAMVSCYKVQQDYKDGIKLSWPEFFEASIAGAITYGSWFDHVLNVEQIMADHPEVPVYIHVFEEMKQNPVRSIKKLCAFLKVSDHLAPDIAKATGLQNIKEIVNENLESVNVKIFDADTKPSLIQKGNIGTWKQKFTVDQNIRFNQLFEEKMAGSKLAALIREYI